MVENSAERKITDREKFFNKESSTMLNDQAIELNFVRNRLETFQDTVLRDVQQSMSGMTEEVMEELRQHQLRINEFRNFAKPQTLYPSEQTMSCGNRSHIPIAKQKAATCEEQNELKVNKTIGRDLSNCALDTDEPVKESSLRRHDALQSKVFVMRESLLTALLEVEHMKTIYHIFYIIFLVFLLNNISYEYLVTGSVSFGLGRFRTGFQNIDKVACVWILQHGFVFIIYFALKIWAEVRIKLSKHKSLQHLWSYSCLLIYIISQLTFAYLPTKICLQLNLPFVTASVLLLESVRLLMKMHSFVRTIGARIIVGKVKTEQESFKQANYPYFQKYLYFLFAPTLLYKDVYPRTLTIRWKFALSRLVEVIAVAFLYNYIYERHIKHHFGNFCLEELNAATLTIKLFGMLMPSIIIFLTGFYMILHAWLNFTAELLRFGDRMFYRDWWTVSSYDAYYRNWNVVVHDWLYEYIYKDFYNHIFKGSKNLSFLTVFIISALFHEYVLGYALQVFFPVMFFFFGVIGVIFIYLTRYTSKNVGNIFVWFSLIYGNSWVISFYSMEYFTRINCPKEFNSWGDYFVPHVWSYFK